MELQVKARQQHMTEPEGTLLCSGNNSVSGQDGQQADFQVKGTLIYHETDNSKASEAQTIWNKAKELGMTWELDQEKIIGRIEEMEERDLKEANKLGARSKNP